MAIVYVKAKITVEVELDMPIEEFGWVRDFANDGTLLKYKALGLVNQGEFIGAKVEVANADEWRTK